MNLHYLADYQPCFNNKLFREYYRLYQVQRAIKNEGTVDMHKSIFIFTKLIVIVLIAVACSNPGNTPAPSPMPTPDDNIEIRPAPIHEATVSIAESHPPQIFVTIKGGLSDGCTTLNEIRISRDGNTVTISVSTSRPKDKMCTAIYTYFDKTVNIGSDFVKGQDYMLRVNDHATTFKYPQ